MAVTYTTAVKNARMAAVRTAILAGGGDSRLRLGTAAMAAVLAEFVIAGGSETNGVLTLTTFPQTVQGLEAAGAGTAAVAARIIDGDGTTVVDGLTVGIGSSFDVNLVSTSIAEDQDVTLNSASLTHAA